MTTSRKRFGIKSLAVLLAILTTLMALPLGVFAQMAEDLYSETETVSQAAEEVVEREPFELTSLREENVKQYQMPDGTRVAAMYNSPVHYLDEDGTWQDIDNTLHEDGSSYGTDNARVKFVKKITGNGEIFTLHEHNRKITWSLEGASKRVKGEVTNTETEHGEDATALQKLMTLDHLSSTVVYPDILDGVDLEYILSSGNIKENIVVKERGESYLYRFTLKLNNLTAAMNGTGDILLTDTGTSELAYVIPAPFMTDAAGAVSHAVTYALVDNGNGSYTLEVAADADWINADERALPVRIDPTVRTDSYTSLLELQVPIYSSGQTVQGGESFTVGATSDVYWKVSDLPYIPDLATIVEATLTLYVESVDLQGAASYEIALCDVLSDWGADLTRGKINDASTDQGRIAYAYTDAYEFSEAQSYSFTITPIVNKWYRGSNYGLCLTPIVQTPRPAGGVTFRSNTSSESTGLPELTVVYSSNRGIEDYYSYMSQSAGYAGSGAINYAAGELTFMIPTLTTQDSLFSFTPALYYNGELAGKYVTRENVGTGREEANAPLGFHWSIGETVTYDEGFTYYIWMDADGTEHMFYPSGAPNTYYDTDGLQLKLEIVNSQVLITAPSGTVRVFTGGYAGHYYLTAIRDTNGNELRIVLDSQERPTQIAIVPNGLSAITQLYIEYNGAGMPYLVLDATSGEAVVFRYSQSPKGTSFTYADSGYLREVIRAHGSVSTGAWQSFYNSRSNSSTVIAVDAVASYIYDVNGRLVSVTNGLSQYCITYTYDTSGRVVNVQESSTSGTRATGQQVGLTYSLFSTVVRTSGADDTYNTSDDLLTTYSHDGYGRVVSSYTTDLEQTKFYGAAHAGYDAGQMGSYNANTDKSRNSIKQSVVSTQHSANYITYGGFDGTNATVDPWVSTGSVSLSTDTYHDGGRSIRLSAGGTIPATLSQTVYLPAGDYTLSFMINTHRNVNGSVRVSAYSVPKSYDVAEIDVPLDRYETVEGFALVSMHFTADATLSYTSPEAFVISFEVTSVHDDVYIDSVMLSKTDGVAEYDLTDFGHFENVNANGIASSVWSGDMSESALIVDSGNELFGYVAKLDAGETGVLSQTVYRASAERRTAYAQGAYRESAATYTFSAWAKSGALAYGKSSNFILRLMITYYHDGHNDPTEYVTLYFDRGLTEWQFLSGTMTTDPSLGMVDTVTVSIRYENQPEPGYFDSITVTKDSSATSVYKYNSGGFVTMARNGNNVTRYEYSEENPALVTRAIYSDKSVVTYEYDEKDRVIEESYGRYTGSGTSAEELGAVNVLRRATYTYDAWGFLTSTTVYEGSDTYGARIASSTDYVTTSGSHIFGAVESTTDSLGNVTRYFYHTSNGRLLAEIYPEGNGISYVYDGMGNLTEVHEATYNATGNSYTASDEVAVGYAYDTVTKRLNTITTDSSVYRFTYDGFGNTTEITVGGATNGYTLAEYTYDARNGKLEQMLYGNGLRVIYTYDALDRVEQIRYNGVVKYTYDYDARGLLHSVTDHDNDEVTVYRYDGSGRVEQSYTYSTEDYVNLYSTTVRYDAEDRVDLVYHNLDYPCYTSTGYYYESVRYDYGYDDYSGNITSLGIGFTTDTADIHIYPYYDNLGRLSSRTVRTAGFGLETYYDYETVTVDGVVYESARVSMYYGDMGDYQFVYDDNGNLTEIQLGGVHDGVAGETQYRYDYDSKGQLIREDNAPLNKTYTYTYDAAGNITAKRVYPFTTGALGIAEQTITYTYGDSEWGDLLTGWNGYTMQYGNVGNLEAIIASDNSGYDLNWQGRRLVSYIGTHSMDYNSADDIYSRIDFTYNADGIRTSKTVNGVEHQYILNGSQIIAERWTETVNGEAQEQLLLYLYDETGAPMGLAYRNEDYYENEYDRFFFHRSLQGDITAIYSNNRQIGSYTYDAWGNFTVTQEEGNTALENLVLNTYNPFRYRGYYYDVETGLYYLQSRYYNPEWGRFISADGYLSTGQGILGYNMFAYCGNSPVLRTDYTGEIWISAIILVGIVSVLTVALSGGSPQGPPRRELAKASDLDINTASADSYDCYGNAIGKQTTLDPKGYFEGASTEEVFAMVVNDLGDDNVRRLNSINDTIGDDEYMVALKCGPTDFHFVRRISDEVWFNKSGPLGGVYVPTHWVECETWRGIGINDEGRREQLLKYDDATIYFAVKIGWDE